MLCTIILTGRFPLPNLIKIGIHDTLYYLKIDVCKLLKYFMCLYFSFVVVSNRQLSNDKIYSLDWIIYLSYQNRKYKTA